MDTIVEWYHTRAPRWVKVIRWRELSAIFVTRQKLLAKIFYGPAVVIFLCCNENPLAHQLWVRRPQSEEELMELKRNYFPFSTFQRDWEKGQYFYEMPPKYDLAERRKKYPEYYGNRYDGFKRYGV